MISDLLLQSISNCTTLFQNIVNFYLILTDVIFLNFPAATINQPNFTNWTPLKPGSFSSSNSSNTTTPNENNNTLTDDKLGKQNVKYDISTGKVYEELGNPCGNRSGPPGAGPVNDVSIGGGVAAVTASRPTPLDYNPYAGQQTYQSSSYPYGNYMSSFGAHYGATTAAAAASYPYDRTSMYSYGAGMCKDSWRVIDISSKLTVT